MRLYPGIRAGPYMRKHPSKFVCKISLKISVPMVVGHLNSLIWPFFHPYTFLVMGYFTKKMWPGESLRPKYIDFL